MASQTGESSRFAEAGRTATCLDPNRVDERHLTRPAERQRFGRAGQLVADAGPQVDVHVQGTEEQSSWAGNRHSVKSRRAASSRSARTFNPGSGTHLALPQTLKVARHHPAWAVGRIRISFNATRRGRPTAKAITSATSAAVIANCS